MPLLLRVVWLLLLLLLLSPGRCRLRAAVAAGGCRWHAPARLRLAWPSGRAPGGVLRLRLRQALKLGLPLLLSSGESRLTHATGTRVCARGPGVAAVGPLGVPRLRLPRRRRGARRWHGGGARRSCSRRSAALLRTAARKRVASGARRDVS
jgi:hypothetical protein